MYFEKYNAIYLHPGKTAGTAIEQTILPGDREVSLTDRKSLFGWDNEFNIYLQHATAQRTRKLLGNDVFSQAFRFMSVRNPYTRMISVYNYGFKGYEKRFGGFRPFILQLPKLVEEQSSLDGSHLSPQFLFATIQGDPVCDIVVRFESLNQGFHQVAHTLKAEWSLQKPSKHRHQGNSKSKLSEYYDVEMIEAMQIAYADDFQFFDYPNVPHGLLTREVTFAL